MRNLNRSTTTSRPVPSDAYRDSPWRRLSQQIRVSRSTDSAVLAGIHIQGSAISRHSTFPFDLSSLPRVVLLLVFRRVRRTRAIRIMLPSSARSSSASDYYYFFLDTRRVTRTSPKISSWTHLLSGTNICLSCLGCQLRVFECS